VEIFVSEMGVGSISAQISGERVPVLPRGAVCVILRLDVLTDLRTDT